jgi:hypothetical protein
VLECLPKASKIAKVPTPSPVMPATIGRSLAMVRDEDMVVRGSLLLVDFLFNAARTYYRKL